MNAKIGTARTNAANRRWSCATAQMATRLPTTGKVRVLGLDVRLCPSRRFRCCSLGGQSLRARRRVDGRGRSPVRLLVLAVRQERGDDHDAGEHHQTGDGTEHEQQFAVHHAVHHVASLRGCRGRARGACLPLALELSHVGDDRPPVRRRDRPAVPGHQPCPVRDDVEDLPVRYFRIFSWWKVAVGTLPRWNRIPLPSPRASWQGWQ